MAIVSVAAVCAGYLWLERHQVRRAARVRGEQRRHVGVLRSCEPGVAADPPASKSLERCIEDAVRSADFACAYHQRLFLRGASGESPFQLRRARVDAAQRRFAQASLRLEEQAGQWLSSAESDPSIDAQAKLAVARMHDWLGEHPVSKRFPVGDDQPVTASVDVFENALANLRQRRGRGSGADPFRHAVGAAARQDVTPTSERVPPRHDAGLLPATHR